MDGYSMPGCGSGRASQVPKKKHVVKYSVHGLMTGNASHLGPCNVNFTIISKVPIIKFRRTSPGHQYYKQY